MPSPPSDQDFKLRTVLEHQLLENRAHLDALRRCQQAGDLEGILHFVDATREELRKARDDRDKTYLFAYLDQLEKVVGLLTEKKREAKQYNA